MTHIVSAERDRVPRLICDACGEPIDEVNDEEPHETDDRVFHREHCPICEPALPSWFLAAEVVFP